MWAVYTLPLCRSLGSKTHKLTPGHSSEVCCVVCDVVCGTCACTVWWWCACVYVCVWCVCIWMGGCVIWHMCVCGVCGVCACTVCSVIISQGMKQLDPLEHDLRCQEWGPFIHLSWDKRYLISAFLSVSVPFSCCSLLTIGCLPCFSVALLLPFSSRIQYYPSNHSSNKMY